MIPEIISKHYLSEGESEAGEYRWNKSGHELIILESALMDKWVCIFLFCLYLYMFEIFHSKKLFKKEESLMLAFVLNE